MSATTQTSVLTAQRPSIFRRGLMVTWSHKQIALH